MRLSIITFVAGAILPLVAGAAAAPALAEIRLGISVAPPVYYYGPNYGTYYGYYPRTYQNPYYGPYYNPGYRHHSRPYSSDPYRTQYYYHNYPGYYGR